MVTHALTLTHTCTYGIIYLSILVSMILGPPPWNDNEDRRRKVFPARDNRSNYRKQHYNDEPPRQRNGSNYPNREDRAPFSDANKGIVIISGFM